VVRAAVVAGEPGAVEGDDDRQLLEAGVVDDLVVGALEKRGVDGGDRP
jgi:hypothetical protein